MRLIVLRPEPGASTTVARAAALGLAAEAWPLFRIEPLAWSAPDPDKFDGLLLTSANAVRQAGPNLAALRRLLVFAVGEATAAAASDAGLAVAGTGTGGVGDLLAALPLELRLLHLCGQDHAEPTLPRSIASVAVYRAATIDPAPALVLLAPAVLLVHSPRAGRRLAELLPDRAGLRIAALSPAAAAACGPGWDRVEAATAPTDAALLSLAARLCQQSDPQ